jgi:hypothetical protein
MDRGFLFFDPIIKVMPKCPPVEVAYVTLLRDDCHPLLIKVEGLPQILGGYVGQVGRFACPTLPEILDAL